VQILAIELHALFWDRNGLQMLEGNSISPEPGRQVTSIYDLDKFKVTSTHTLPSNDVADCFALSIFTTPQNAKRNINPLI
jgi:hypothetical protein